MSAKVKMELTDTKMYFEQTNYILYPKYTF